MASRFSLLLGRHHSEKARIRFVPDPSAATGGESTGRARGDENAERARANAEFSRAYRTLTNTVRLFGAFAFFYFAMFCIALWSRSLAGVEGKPIEFGFKLFLSITLSFSVISLIGARSVRRRPLRWSVVSALLTTLFWIGMCAIYLFTASRIRSGPRSGNPFPWLALLFTVMTIASWINVPKLIVTERLLGKYPDAVGARRLRGFKREREAR